MIQSAHNEVSHLNQEIELLNRVDSIADYLKIDELLHGYAYKIVARNAYVGIWNELKHAFIISRYKFSLTPYLFEEYHWDADPRIGTVKPLQQIEKAPFENYYEHEKAVTEYLDTLEQHYPLFEGVDTVEKRRESIRTYQNRTAKR